MSRLFLRGYLLVLLSVLPSWAWAQHQQVLPSFAQVRASFQASDGILLDRFGEPLADVRFDLHVRRTEWLPLDSMPPALREALLAAEDKRFFEHTGVDWVAVASAAWQNLWGSGARRGASTLTMQLAGLLDPSLRMPIARGARRSVTQIWDQGWAAVELEKHWSKAQILEAYLNLAPFRGDLEGVGIASEVLFGVPVTKIGLREASLLAALLRGPNAPPPLVAKRACLLVGKLGHAAQCPELTRLALSRLDLPRGTRYSLAPHVARLLVKYPAVLVQSTLDAALQRKLIGELKAWPDPKAAVIVLDNASGEVLAWVGGQNPTATDGVGMRRVLPEWSWPHLAALALERRQITAATPLADAGSVFDVNDLHSAQSWHSLRSALATHQTGGMRQIAARLGHDVVVERLRALGDSPGEHGDCNELSLAQLAAAWRSLAANGNFVPPRLLPSDNGTKNVLRPEAAFIVQDVLGQTPGHTWRALWTMTDTATGDTVVVGNVDRITLAFSAQSLADPIASWQNLIKGLNIESSRPPQAPEGVEQALVYFEPANEPPRREWFLRGAVLAGTVSYMPGRLARIVEPQQGSTRQISLADGEHWALRAQAGVAVHWALDGSVLGEGTHLEWVPKAGEHRLSLLGANEELLDTVDFDVSAPEQP